MRWPWSRNRQETSPVSDDVAEATRARRRAELALEAAKERTGEIHKAASELRRHQRVNHFAELIDETFRGRR